MGNREFFRFVVIGVSLLLGACSADMVLPGFGARRPVGARGTGGRSIAGRAPAGGGYRALCLALLAVPRNNVKFRPDLETYLDGMAAATRRSSGLSAHCRGGHRMKEAARAQALDMALGGYVGHASRNGYAFVKRARTPIRITARTAGAPRMPR